MTALAPSDHSTRERILDLVVQHGPITASRLASTLNLTSAAVRRHILALEADELIAEHDVFGPSEPRRGRPARQYVATKTGLSRLSNAYSDIATSSLGFIEKELGEDGVEAFAAATFAAIFQDYGAVMANAGTDPRARVTALAEELTEDGFAATIREVGGDFALQLCQGACPIMRVASAYPQLCAAETRAFGELLGLHVQRLATLADGEHVCTTNIPLIVRPQIV